MYREKIVKTPFPGGGLYRVGGTGPWQSGYEKE
jgi:hypothetical protein